MKYILFLAGIFFLNVNQIQAQTAEDSVKAVINALFQGMKDADSELLASAFGDSAILQTISQTKEGSTVIRTENIQKFIDFAGKQQKGAADEHFVFETIKIDGPLAFVWTPYKFYFNSKFSHCGVNSFQLVRFNGQWKIQYLIDTRRRRDCE